MNPFQDVFISYGRADSLGFAAKLNQRLTEAGLEVWFDFDDIPLGVDYQKQIDDGIDKADNFLFVIAPHSINSPYCRLEVELAVKRNKRIIPLLHVEEISCETWRQRNPHGADADWETYKLAGKHSSFPNMHPIVGKINWVYFREGQDDFEKSFKDLLEIFDRDKSYVREHTALLNQALTWEANHRKPRDLLVEAPLRKAEAWLQTQFRDRQPPCTPTKLHCQFITESIKNTQDGMTEVFLSHASEDQQALETLYDTLTRAGLTVWTNWRDIQTGVDFQEAINQGIEGTDNVIYLISSNALASKWCQYEINYALSLNKRIIPVLIEAIDLETLPENIRQLQFIDFTDNSQAADYQANESEILKVLGQDSDYYHAHKLLLVDALKWERQLRNPCILLRGYALRQTEAWLKIAQKRRRDRPLPIQQEFVQESLNQPPDVSLNVFIACDSKDLELARKLNDTLQIQGERTWFEPDKTVLGPDGDAQVKEAIERAENFILVVSPEALADASLLADLQTAAALSKRIIAVMARPLVSAELPATLAQRPQVDFSSPESEFMSDFGVLYRILKSHPDHVRDHTRLLIRAVEWDQAGQEDSTLLRGKELTKAQQWLALAEAQTPKPSDLQVAYLEASQALAQRKVKSRSVAGISVGVTLLVLIARIMGLLQGLELFAYDRLLQQRPNEARDDRFLIVSVDEESGAFIRDGLIEERYEPSIGTIPDDALNQALGILSDSEARLIGLDFYRDFPAAPALAETFETADNLITICKASYDDTAGVPKAEAVPLARVGFSDLVSDRPKGAAYVRRHYLMQGPNPVCETPTSLSLSLASRYLAQEGVTMTNPLKPEGGFGGNGLQFDEFVVPNLSLLRGPYYPKGLDLSVFGGYQTLVNFRTVANPEAGEPKDPQGFAPVISLADLLTGEVPATLQDEFDSLDDLVRDRIVLIGYADFADRNADYWGTPHGTMPGVFVQGQMTSQLISAVLDGRSLIRWWPIGTEVLWIFAWAAAGGVMARYALYPRRTAIGATLGIGLLYASGYGAMVLGALWIPLVPPLVAFVLTAGGVSLLNYRLRQP